MQIMNGKNGFGLLQQYRSAVMGFSALWIFLFHEWIPVFGRYPKISMLENFMQRIGYCGVDIFLFLSGIGMVYSIGKSQNLRLFYYKRVKRLLLPFLLVALLRYRIEHWSAAQFWQNITGISFFQVNIYTFLWFVPMIVIFYCLFPLYYRFFIKSSNKFMFTCGILMLWLIGTLRFRMILREDMFGVINRIPIFIIGIFMGWLSQNKNVIFDKLTWGFLTVMLVLGIYLSYLSNYTGMYILVPVSNCCIPDIFIAISLSFLLAGLFYLLNKKRFLKVIGAALAHVLSFYGIFTLEFYCIQEWLGGLLIPQMREQYSPKVINIAVLAAITAAALLLHFISGYFWLFTERIARTFKAAFPLPKDIKVKTTNK